MAVAANEAKSAVATAGNEGKTFIEQFLLLENGFRILLESGGGIILEQSVPAEVSWSNPSKS